MTGMSLTMPAVLGALTLVGFMAFSEAPASVGEPSEEESAGRESAPAATDSSQTSPRTDDKPAPASKPRIKKPGDGTSLVLYAVIDRPDSAFRVC